MIEFISFETLKKNNVHLVSISVAFLEIFFPALQKYGFKIIASYSKVNKLSNSTKLKRRN